MSELFFGTIRVLFWAGVIALYLHFVGKNMKAWGKRFNISFATAGKFFGKIWSVVTRTGNMAAQRFEDAEEYYAAPKCPHCGLRVLGSTCRYCGRGMDDTPKA